MSRLRPTFLWLEFAFAAVILAGLAYSFWYLAAYGHFPQPFFYDVGDTWMDWFNPAFWAHNPGAYDSYLSIYPPLTFVILKFITLGRCYDTGGGWPRDCDWLGIATLHLSYILAIVLTAWAFLKIDRRTALPRSLALSMGMPMMWALDRGNVILITYIFVLLAYGPLLRGSMARAAFAGAAVNMKVYLIGTIFAQLLHRRWAWSERALIATVLVFCISFAILGTGTPMEIYRNVVGFSSDLVINNPLDIWMASSLLPLGKLTVSDVFPTTLYIGSRNVELIQFLAPLITHTAQFVVILGAAACYVRPEVVPRYRMLTLSIGLATFTAEVSGYSEILVLFFCFMEPARGILRRYAIVAGYLLCIPLDYEIGQVGEMVKDSFLLRRTVIVEYVVQIGPFVRPLLMISIPVALALATIVAVLRDVWAGGWAERWRYRNDAPFLPWLKRPVPPQA